MVINAELKPESLVNMTLAAAHHIIHVISRGSSNMNFREDTGIEREAIQASLYHHATIPQIQDKQ